MPSTSAPRRQIVAITLLCFVVVFWGFNWPVMKQLVVLSPPIWVAAVCMAGAALCLFALQLATGDLTWPERADLPVLASSALGMMALPTPLVNLGLQLVSAGRSAILAYTLPLWVIPIAALWLREPITLNRMGGLTLGLSGLLLLFRPASFDWSSAASIIGNGLVIVASITTAVPIVHMRAHQWRGNPNSLAPWQFAIATFILIPVAWGLEGLPSVAAAWSPRIVLLLAYAIVPGTAFGFWALTWISKELPAMTTSLGLLAVPLVGVSASNLVLGEPMSLTLLTALGLIAAGVIVGTLRGRRASQPA